MAEHAKPHGHDADPPEDPDAREGGALRGERSIEVRISEAFDSLPESERKVAEVILEFPGDLGAFKATELAARAGVSKAAATRLFRRLGFASFDEARVMARERRDWGSPLYMEGKAGQHGMTGGLGNLLRDEIALLQRSLVRLDPQVIDELAAAAVGARRVWLVGFRNSRFIAEYLRWQLLQFRGDVVLLPGTGETAGEYLADMTGADLLIVVGLRRRVKGLDEVVAAARDQATPVAVITDPTARRLLAMARWTLVVETRGSFAFDSCGPALALCRYLSVEALHKAGRPGRTHLERVERQHERLDSFS